MSEPLILVVDDDPGMLQLLGMRLKAFGFRTLAARSGPEALALLEQHPVHVLVSDLRMEPMDGMALFARVHERWPVLPVIMLTAHGTIRDAVDATREGIFAFLTKPVDRDELHSTLNSALALHRPGEQAGAAPGGETRLLTRSARMYRLLEQARLYAESDVNILITGESGTGKELLADSIHRASARADKPFVAINCSAIPQELLESELFGYVKGAFTGANQDREGLFSTAEGGTVLLDEIGDMPYALQAKLLRVLQENVLRPVGGRADIPIDVRIISATHIDLPAAIADKRFREDLYYRLNVVSLALPPLRERREDIPLLVEHFLAKIARRTGKAEKTLAPDALGLLLGYHWPGNIRQLENVMERLFALASGPVISATLAQQALPGDAPLRIASLSEARKDFERDYLARLLAATNGNMTVAAELAGRNRSDFHKLVKRHGLNPAQYRRAGEEEGDGGEGG
ncbi:MAG: sigma 54-interacting transcriptional regulator [Porticoccaceae bacterium]|jgi:two-component system response regulator GlrR|nr:sigma 54-interacting transcriptional regulator [Porticoccaceae bacterium]HLS99468.1 sigma 54-interacting transcriptional regulator [Porticoccaceae bacterium]